MSAPNVQHAATIARLAGIKDPEVLLGTSAAIAAEAKKARDEPPEGGTSLLDRRNHLFTALHVLWSVPKSRIADRAGLDRRMIHVALEKHPVDMDALPRLPRWDEERAVTTVKTASLALKTAVHDAASAETPKEKRAADLARDKAEQERDTAILVLYFRFGKNDKDRPTGWSRARIANKLRVGHEVAAGVLDPILREMFSFGDIDQETADREAFRLAEETRELLEIHLTASRICQQTGTAMMAGELGGRVYENAEIVVITGLKPPTISQWRTGNSNRWKQEERRKPKADLRPAV